MPNTMIPIESKDQLIQIMDAEEVLVVYFSSADCSVCHSVSPKIEALLEEVPVKIVKVEASKFVDIAGQHLVFAMPTVLVFQNGKEILRESRFIDFQKIERLMSLLFE
ncbi:thioredoxin family protein [Acidaminobacter sp.]|uniref:thioredoxin family protein n=1 Tax=Acidaminobacter sp. TaxID=1872102 RepID=UPI001381065C|nr:thioredoxin family protein [Acidaminobacter sp.]MDK9711075.1 thioredoxin family protein [Acidaminobacter sp.]MZQ97337.1 thioredoxin [Acidaminobacter sp.]